MEPIITDELLGYNSQGKEVMNELTDDQESDRSSECVSVNSDGGNRIEETPNMGKIDINQLFTMLSAQIGTLGTKLEYKIDSTNNKIDSTNIKMEKFRTNMGELKINMGFQITESKTDYTKSNIQQIDKDNLIIKTNDGKVDNNDSGENIWVSDKNDFIFKEVIDKTDSIVYVREEIEETDVDLVRNFEGIGENNNKQGEIILNSDKENVLMLKGVTANDVNSGEVNSVTFQVPTEVNKPGERVLDRNCEVIWENNSKQGVLEINNVPGDILVVIKQTIEDNILENLDESDPINSSSREVALIEINKDNLTSNLEEILDNDKVQEDLLEVNKTEIILIQEENIILEVNSDEKVKTRSVTRKFENEWTTGSKIKTNFKNKNRIVGNIKNLKYRKQGLKYAFGNKLSTSKKKEQNKLTRLRINKTNWGMKLGIHRTDGKKRLRPCKLINKGRVLKYYEFSPCKTRKKQTK